MIERWQREIRLRRAESKARLMVRVVNRTFKKQPNRVDRFAHTLVDKSVDKGTK